MCFLTDKNSTTVLNQGCVGLVQTSEKSTDNNTNTKISCVNSLKQKNICAHVRPHD